LLVRATPGRHLGHDEVVIVLQDLGQQIDVELDVFDNQDGFQVYLLISSPQPSQDRLIIQHIGNFIHQFFALEALFFHYKSDAFS
jgi:hypothetical protein